MWRGSADQAAESAASAELADEIADMRPNLSSKPLSRRRNANERLLGEVLDGLRIADPSGDDTTDDLSGVAERIACSIVCSRSHPGTVPPSSRRRTGRTGISKS